MYPVITEGLVVSRKAHKEKKRKIEIPYKEDILKDILATTSSSSW
jgi:hypothetical protein